MRSQEAGTGPQAVDNGAGLVSVGRALCITVRSAAADDHMSRSGHATCGHGTAYAEAGDPVIRVALKSLLYNENSKA